MHSHMHAFHFGCEFTHCEELGSARLRCHLRLKPEKCGDHFLIYASNMPLPPDRHSYQDSAFSTIQPMNTALYFDDIEGFGEWPILLSTRAQKYLWDARRTNVATFRIVMKKIK